MMLSTASNEPTTVLINNNNNNSSHKKKKKPSVHFDLSLIPPATEEDPYQPSSSSSSSNECEFLLSPPTCVIDIQGQLVPDTMLVSLVNRPQEMRDLVHHNPTFFHHQVAPTLPSWSQFEQNVLYADRSQLSDEAWLAVISKSLAPTLMNKLKDLVGYLGSEEEEEEEEKDIYRHVDLSRIRPNIHNCLTTDAYPQFFIHCQEELKEGYDRFLADVLFNEKLSDDDWRLKIEGYLSFHLLQQLQEIVAYETEQE
ncbi:MAG: hypothetical protein EXX96DRAFT_106395 [Benjaminiella poitrasii]|nr:MAG: hypothetical protein EXX96DRAFT_106395 [Benjaminiella poitrasii]